MHKSTAFTPAHLFFGRRLNVPLDIVYGEITNDSKIGDFGTFIKKIEDLYEHARESLKTQQEVSTTYYDKKVIDDKLRCGNLVYVYLPRNRRIKLAKKWEGPAKVTKCNHPLYEIKRLTAKGETLNWTIRNKLKRAPVDTVWEYPSNNIDEAAVTTTAEYEDESSSSDQSDTENGNGTI